MLGSGRGAGCESVRAGCLGVSARLWKEGCMCAEGADGARRPLRSRPVVCSCVWVWGPGGQGAGAAQGRAGTPGGSPGPWVCMVLQLTRAGSSLGPICTQQETEAQRGGDTGGVPWPAPQAHPTAAQAMHSAMPGCARRHALGVPGRGRNIPPVCRVPTGPGGAGSSRPRPVARLAGRSWQGWPGAGAGGA